MDDKVRVLVADDSVFARFSISNNLKSDPEIEVVGTPRNGIEALKAVADLRPDVVTLDVLMPEMDGLVALERIMSECPTPVIMLSGLTGEGTEATIRALELGAVDFFLKPSASTPIGSPEQVEDLCNRIKIAAKVEIGSLGANHSPAAIRAGAREPSGRRSASLNRMIVIGSSTGGPRALTDLLPAFPARLPASILIVQHMPPGFTRSLAERLDSVCELDVKEAVSGETVRPGLALVAPGGYHMVVDEHGSVTLNDEPPECGLRPAVNVTMESVARCYGQSSVGVTLTGMGSDGTRGSALIKAVGGETIVQDQSTCVVFGMPRSVIESGNADRVVNLREIAEAVIEMCDEEKAEAQHG
ncbi:MAG: chemotaxis response regulator protein-glutamate methylesterase [Dehalococcoidia bacterium]